MTCISIKDIAKKVGVSNATVSLVLNGKGKEGRIRDEVAKKVLRAAKELNYQPNNFARGLRMGRSDTIGLILADISNNFFANIAFYIQEYAEAYGYSVIITNTNESDHRWYLFCDKQYLRYRDKTATKDRYTDSGRY